MKILWAFFIVGNLNMRGFGSYTEYVCTSKNYQWYEDQEI